jgi:hypothetical protein
MCNHMHRTGRPWGELLWAQQRSCKLKQVRLTFLSVPLRVQRTLSICWAPILCTSLTSFSALDIYPLSHLFAVCKIICSLVSLDLPDVYDAMVLPANTLAQLQVSVKRTGGAMLFLTHPFICHIMSLRKGLTIPCLFSSSFSCFAMWVRAECCQSSIIVCSSVCVINPAQGGRCYVSPHNSWRRFKLNFLLMWLLHFHIDFCYFLLLPKLVGWRWTVHLIVNSKPVPLWCLKYAWIHAASCKF